MNVEIFLQFFFSAALIWLAARWLAKASDEIAHITGLGHFFVGSVFLAASTSTPEFFVDIEAARKGLPDLAAGDLLGSSLVNLVLLCSLTLIFGKTNCTLPRQTRLASWLAAILTAEVGLFILGGDLSLMGVSLPGFMLLLTYLAGLRIIFEKPQAENQQAVQKSRPKLLFKPVMVFISGTALIFFVSPFLVSSVEKIAAQTGLGATFIGTSLLALTTSFPELSSSFAATRMGLFPLVAGNIVGSNCINMLIFSVMDGIWKNGSLWPHLSSKNLIAVGFVVMNMALLAASDRLKAGRCLIADRTRLWLILVSSLGCYIVLYFLKDAVW